MEKQYIKIENIPAIIWGEKSDKVYIFVHGKMGRKEDASHFAEYAKSKGYQTISFDLPEHGERKNEDYPLMVWNAVDDLKTVYNFVSENWKAINLYACSIGAYFSLLSYKGYKIEKSLFQCPLLDMEKLIKNMMLWFNITEEQLQKEKEIPTPMGETLYWDYYVYTKEHQIEKWDSKTYIIYPSKDNLTERNTVDNFVQKYSANLTIIEDAEHYFTDIKYSQQLDNWLEKNI